MKKKKNSYSSTLAYTRKLCSIKFTIYRPTTNILPLVVTSLHNLYSASALLAMRTAVLARPFLSVHLSVSHSVTLQYCAYRNKDTIVRSIWPKNFCRRGRHHQPFFLFENQMHRSFIRYKNASRTFIRFVTIHAFDEQTDGQTARLPIPHFIQCSSVKKGQPVQCWAL